MDSPDVDAPARGTEIALAILGAVFAQQRLLDGADASRPRHPLHVERALAFVVERRPVTLVLPGFPAKSPSRRKVLGVLPDAAERISLRFLAGLVDEIARIHAPGARLVICSDGAVFADVVGVRDADVLAYRAALARMIEREARGRIELFHLGDAFRGVDVADARARLLARWARTTGAIRARAKGDAAARAQLDGVHRFLFEELVLEQPELSRSKARALTRDRAVETVRRSDAWSSLVADAFPGALRLSIHPQPTASTKIGVHLVPTQDAWLTPWHGVAVLRDGKLELMKRADAEALGARVVVEDGAPSHMVLS